MLNTLSNHKPVSVYFRKDWGDQGHFWLPFDYCKQHLTDAWIIDIVLG